MKIFSFRNSQNCINSSLDLVNHLLYILKIDVEYGDEMERQPKYFVRVLQREKAFNVPIEVTSSLKGVVSGKMMNRMKHESVQCPVVKEEVPFLDCFACESFIRRVKGEVHCFGSKGPSRFSKP